MKNVFKSYFVEMEFIDLAYEIAVSAHFHVKIDYSEIERGWSMPELTVWCPENRLAEFEDLLAEFI